LRPLVRIAHQAVSPLNAQNGHKKSVERFETLPPTTFSGLVTRKDIQVVGQISRGQTDHMTVSPRASPYLASSKAFTLLI
jgi:hypothetical protein